MDARCRVVLTLFVSIVVQLGSISTPAIASEPATLFKTKCSSCHTFGKGDLIGPDLKGATDRHPRSWLIAWIRSSESVIRRGDPAAVALFRQYRRQRMPDHELSDADIAALVDYLGSGGPARDGEPRLRLAADAKPDDAQRGRKLFVGEARLASGGMACAFCHTVSMQSVRGGTFGPDLTNVYPRYFDWALDRELRRHCFTSTGAPAECVDDGESFALRAFLRAAGQRATSGSPSPSNAGTGVPAGRE